jgi:hypothetical protein
MAEQQPSVGRIVHYVSHGTPGGEYGKECRAAIVTRVLYEGMDPGAGWVVGLAVLNPEGMFFNQTVPYDEWDSGTAIEGAEPRGGSWHWPERV